MRTRRQDARDKALRERRIECRLWKRWRRERVEQLLAGPYAELAQALLAFFKTMTTPSPLIDFVAAGPWGDADADVRFEIFALVDAVIVKRRERMGLAPFDDALSGQPLNVFLILRERLSPFPPDGGAARGAARFNQQNTNASNSNDNQRSYSS